MVEKAIPILLEGKYRLAEEIGRGGMGAVFRAIDTSLGRSVAVKFLLPELLEHQELIEGFHAEAQAMASIQHPNVAQIFSFGWFGKAPYFVMEYAEGQTADQLILAAVRRRSFVPLSEALDLLDQAAAGLAAVHDAGVVHRDVKPGNLIYQPEAGRVVLMDFGIGHRVEPGAKAREAIGGTPAYMAPEIISGQALKSEEEPLADLYSLGITAFELVTGQLPCDCANWIEALTWHLTETPPPPSSLRPELPAALDELILTCLTKEPTARFASCHALREALAPLREHGGSDPSPRPHPSRPLPPPRQSQVQAVPRRVVALVHPSPSLLRMVGGVMEAARDLWRLEVQPSAQQVLEQAAAHSVDVILSDLHATDLNGLELAALVAGDQALRHVRLILIADSVSRSERALLSRLGVVEVLCWPLSTATLSKALASALSPPEPERLAG